MSRAVTRQISNATWQAILATDLVGGTRLEVLEFIYTNGPSTISQALAAIPHKRDSTVNARFSELVDMDLIEIIDTISDPEGTHEVSLYYLTGRMPVKLEKDTGFSCLRLKDYDMCLVLDHDTDVDVWKRFLTKHLKVKPEFALTRVRKLKPFK